MFDQANGFTQTRKLSTKAGTCRAASVGGLQLTHEETFRYQIWLRAHHATSGTTKMMKKKFFNVLILCTIMVCLVMLLGNSQSRFLVYRMKPSNVNENLILSRTAKPGADTFWKLQSEHPKAEEEKDKEPTPLKQTLGPCPDIPPNLVGPLYVDCDQKRTWDYVKNEVSSLLQEGGRYKPSQCISKHKVGEWMQRWIGGWTK